MIPVDGESFRDVASADHDDASRTYIAVKHLSKLIDILIFCGTSVEIGIKAHGMEFVTFNAILYGTD
jgi:hypothetical protein